MFNINATFGTEQQITNEDDFVSETQIAFYHTLEATGYSEIYFGGATIRLSYREIQLPL